MDPQSEIYGQRAEAIRASQRYLPPPLAVPRDHGDDSDSEEANEERNVRYFPTLSVFDIAQTDPIDGADPMPENPTRHLTGDDDHGIIAPLIAHLEADGWRCHGPRAAFDADRIRANELVLLGWTVLRFTSAMTDRCIAETVATALGL